VEASALPPSVALARTRLALGAPLLRLRSDQQLVSLFRSGSEEAFRAIHDRYRQRMFAYTRQMLSGSAVDAEDAVQEIFVRAYSGLRSSSRELALRAWLYRIAHNRCIDELRRPQSVPTETIPATVPNTGGDPIARLEQRDALKRLIADVQRLPDQQRSALLMRELAGMTYADVAGALGVSVAAVKSLLVRARVGLAQASEARDTACARIREDLIVAHDRGVRASGLARRHLRDCPHCRQFRSEVRGVSRQLAAFVPALGPIGVIAKLLGIGGGGGAAAGTGAIAGSGASATAAATTAAGGLAGSGAVGLGAIAGTGHVVTLLAAAVVTAGGAIELQHIAPAAPQRVHHHHAARTPARATSQSGTKSAASSSSAPSASVSQTSSSPLTVSPGSTASGSAANPLASTPSATPTGRGHGRSRLKSRPPGLSLTETLDPDQLSMLYGSGTPPSVTDPADSAGTPTPSPGAPGAVPGSPTDPTSPASTAGTPPPTAASTSPTTATGAAPAGTTATGTATGGTSGTATAGSTGTGTGSSASSAQSGTGSTSSSAGGGSTTKVIPAASTGSINPSRLPAATRPHGHGTIAVFTMTGN
jgi:RNA polymerase sigma factor (sigma-70 family)